MKSKETGAIHIKDHLLFQIYYICNYKNRPD